MNVTFILVRPNYPGNIGSAARAIKNMGFSKLSLVQPAVSHLHPEAVRLAVGAKNLLAKAKVFETIEDATHGINFLVGTSRRTGKYRRDFVSLPELPSKLLKKQKVGILFGSEEKGLTNRELAYCHLVATIPSNPLFPTLNLAQSVMVVAYQLRLSQSLKNAEKTSEKSSDENPAENIPLAPVEDIEGMYQHLEKMLQTIRFFHNKDSFHMMRAIRQLFGRTGMTKREVRIFRGMCRQILWATKNAQKIGAAS